MIIKPIATSYRGYRFRSRLEARWAVCLDALGLDYEYEPQGYHTKVGPYLPDFYLPDLRVFAEVKPAILTDLEFNRAASLEYPCLLLVGVPDGDVPLFAVAHDASACLWGQPRAYDVYARGGLQGGTEQYGWCALAYSAVRGRIWCNYGEGPFAYLYDPMWEEACMAARSTQFGSGVAQ